jgi:hypothetical protein
MKQELNGKITLMGQSLKEVTIVSSSSNDMDMWYQGNFAI